MELAERGRRLGAVASRPAGRWLAPRGKDKSQNFTDSVVVGSGEAELDPDLRRQTAQVRIDHRLAETEQSHLVVQVGVVGVRYVDQLGRLCRSLV